MVKPLLAGLLVALAVFGLSGSQEVSAQGGPEIRSGIIVGVQTGDGGQLVRFALVDAGGEITEYAVRDSTEYGLESQAGDRWVATQAEEPVEAVARLRDHQKRFAPITVVVENGVALSVVELESGRLETNLGFLFAVFAIMWAGFFAYIFFVSRKQRELQTVVARLRARLDEATE